MHRVVCAGGWRGCCSGDTFRVSCNGMDRTKNSFFVSVSGNRSGCETKKRPETEPLGIYFVFPLALAPGWECVYDTADTFVRLDEEQLGNACRDYLTVEKSISVFDEAEV